MDESKSAMTVVLYLALGLGVLFVGVFGFVYFRGGSRALDELNQALDHDLDRRGTPFARTSRGPLARGQVLPERVDRLQMLVDRTASMLESRTRELAQKTKEYEQLEADLEAALDLLVTLSTPPRNQSVKPAESEDASATAASPAELGQVDVDGLRSRLVRYERELTEQLLEIELLRTDLAELNAEMIEDRVFGAQRGFAADLPLIDGEGRRDGKAPNIPPPMATDRAFPEEVSRAMAEIGATAVPKLVELLSNPRADVRRFAAETLGRMGASARVAEGPLSQLVLDEDESVAAAARLALEQIE